MIDRYIFSLLSYSVFRRKYAKLYLSLMLYCFACKYSFESVALLLIDENDEDGFLFCFAVKYIGAVTRADGSLDGDVLLHSLSYLMGLC